MNAISLGPLVLAADRFAVILGIFVFLVITAILARKLDERFSNWSWVTLLSGVIAARAGHMILYLDSFLDEPWRILAFWQGGFAIIPGLVTVLLAILLLKGLKLRLWALLSIAIGLVAWNMTTHLVGGTRAVPLPQMQFATLNDTTFSIEAASGKPIVINLWATWCPPCRREMPMMADIARSNSEVTFVFANQGEGRQQIQSYLDDNNIKLDHVLLDGFGDLRRHYSALGLPATLFIGSDGVLRHAHLGEISRETLQARITALQSSDE